MVTSVGSVSLSVGLDTSTIAQGIARLRSTVGDQTINIRPQADVRQALGSLGSLADSIQSVGTAGANLSVGRLNDMGRSLQTASNSSNLLTQAINSTATATAGINSETVIRLNRSIRDAADASTDLGTAIDRIGGSADTSLPGAIVGFQALADVSGKVLGSIKGFADKGVETYKGFEGALNSFRAVAGATPEELAALEKEALAIGAATSKTANQSAGAAVELAKLGFTAGDTTKNLRGLVSMSEASGASVEMSAKIVGATSSVYGRTAEDIADVVAATSNASAADASDFLGLIAGVGAVAKGNNQDLETLATTFGLVRQAGFGAATGATAVSSIIGRLSTPTQAAAEGMKKLGISVRDSATGEMRNLVELIPEFRTSLNKLKPDEKAVLSSTIFGDVGGPAFLALLETSQDKIDTAYKTIKNATKGETGAGAAFETQQKLMQGLGYATESQAGSIETLQLKLGKSLAPALTAAADAGTFLLGTFLKAPDSIQLVVGGTVALIAATAGLITGYVVLEKLQIIKTAQEIAGAIATTSGIVATKAAAAARTIHAIATTQVTTAMVANNIAAVANVVKTVAVAVATQGSGTAAYFASGGFAAMALSAAAVLAPLAALGAAIGLIAVVQKTQEIAELNAALDDLRAKTDIVGQAGVGSAQDLGNSQRTRAKAAKEGRGLTAVEKEAEKKAMARADRTLPLLEKQRKEAEAVPIAKAGLFGIGKDAAEAQNNARQAAIGQLNMQIDQINRQKAAVEASIKVDKKKLEVQEKAKPTVESVTEALKNQSKALEDDAAKRTLKVESDLLTDKIKPEEAEKQRAAIALDLAKKKAAASEKAVKSLDGAKVKDGDKEALGAIKDGEFNARAELLKAQQEAKKALEAEKEAQKQKKLEAFNSEFEIKQKGIQKVSNTATLTAKREELGGASIEDTAKKMDAIQQTQTAKEIGLLEQKLVATKKLQADGVLSAKESADKQAQIEEELSAKTLSLVEQQIAAKRKAAVAAIDALLSVQKLPLEQQNNDLGIKSQDLELSGKKQTATAGVSDAQAKLDEQRLGFQLQQAELVGDSTKQEQLKESIYQKQLEHLSESQAQQRASVSITRQQQAVELERQEVMAKIAILEAEAALAKAKATGASEEEIAALTQALGFKNQALGQISKVKSAQAEINALDDEKLSIEQKTTRENLEQTRALEKQKAARQKAIEQIEEISKKEERASKLATTVDTIGVRQQELSGDLSAEDAAKKVEQIGIATTQREIGMLQNKLAATNQLRAQGLISVKEAADREAQIQQDLAQANLTLIEKQLAAKRKAAVDAIENELSAKKLPLEQKASDLGFKSQDLDLSVKKQTAITGLLDAQSKLDQQRLGFQLQLADLTGDTAKQEQLKEQIYQGQLQSLSQSEAQQKVNVGIARQQQAIELQRQEITAQIGVLEAEAALAKAKATGASGREIAALSQALALRNQAVGQIGKVRSAQAEINALDDKKLSVEQKTTRENLEQTRALEKQKAARQKAIEQIEEAIKKQERASKLATTVDTIGVRQRELAGGLSAEDAATQIEEIQLKTAGREVGILKNKLTATQQLRSKGLISAKDAADREGQIQQELAQANLALIEKQLEAKRKAAVLAIETQLAAKKLPLEGQLNDLESQKTGLDIESRKQSAKTGLSSAISDLDLQRLEFQLSLADIAENSTKSEQLKKQIYDQQVAALAVQQQAQQQSLLISQKQQAIDLERQKIQAQIALFESQAALEKAKATGAAPREIASLEQVLGFRKQALDQVGQAQQAQEEVNKLEQQKLSVEQLGSREKLSQQKQLEDARKVAEANKNNATSNSGVSANSSNVFDQTPQTSSQNSGVVDPNKMLKPDEKKEQQTLTITAQTAIIQALGAIQADGLKGMGLEASKAEAEKLAAAKDSLPEWLKNMGLETPADPKTVAAAKADIPDVSNLDTSATASSDVPDVETAKNALAEAQKAMQDYADRWNAEARASNEEEAKAYAKRKGINYNTEEGKVAAAIGAAEEATAGGLQEASKAVDKFGEPISGDLKAFEGGQTPVSEFQRLQQQLEEAKNNQIKAQNEANKPKGMEETVTRIYEILAKNFGDIEPTNQPPVEPKIDTEAKQIKMSLEETTNNIYNLLGVIAEKLNENGNGGIENITIVAQNPVTECAQIVGDLTRSRRR